MGHEYYETFVKYRANHFWAMLIKQTSHPPPPSSSKRKFQMEVTQQISRGRRWRNLGHIVTQRVKVRARGRIGPPNSLRTPPPPAFSAPPDRQNALPLRTKTTSPRSVSTNVLSSIPQDRCSSGSLRTDRFWQLDGRTHTEHTG